MKTIWKVSWRILGYDDAPIYESREAFFETKEGAQAFCRELSAAHKLLGFKDILHPSTQEVTLK